MVHTIRSFLYGIMYENVSQFYKIFNICYNRLHSKGSDRMFFFKKKEKISMKDQLLTLLKEDTFEESKVTTYYIKAYNEIIESTSEYDLVEEKKSALFKEIYMTRHGLEWFTMSCIKYLESIKNIEDIEMIAETCDKYLSLYWYLYEFDREAITGLVSKFEELVTPSLRRFYEKNFNTDIYTGDIIDEELEEENAYKQHFYKASFAYNHGNGDLELSIREWRTFLNDLYFTIGTRPRIVYDFAREVVAHQKLFVFLVYALKIEKIDRFRNADTHAEGTPLRTVLSKVVNAVYAIDEDYGMILKKYYA